MAGNGSARCGSRLNREVAFKAIYDIERSAGEILSNADWHVLDLDKVLELARNR